MEEDGVDKDRAQWRGQRDERRRWPTIRCDPEVSRGVLSAGYNNSKIRIFISRDRMKGEERTSSPCSHSYPIHDQWI